MSWLSALVEKSISLPGEVFGGLFPEAPKYPGLSAQEQEYLQMQLDLLRRQGEDVEMMKPFLLKSMGLIEENGELRYMTEAERMEGMSESELRQYEILKLAQERQMKAYAGELPISPALEKNLTDQKKQLSEALAQRLGSDWMTTTAGQQAMSSFEERASLVREEARRGEITGGTGATLSGLTYMGGAREAEKAGAYAFPGRTGGLFAGYGQLGQTYQQDRLMRYQSESQRYAGLMSGYGQLIGAGIGAAGTYYGLKALG